MRRRLIWMLLLAAPVVLMSCGGDDEDPPSGISFELVSEEVTESDGTLTSFSPRVTGGVGVEKQVRLVLDRPVTENTVITYTVGGTANKTNVSNSNGSTSYADFYIEGRNANATETLIINQGASEAIITLTIFEDYEFEVDEEDDNGNFFESIELTLTSVVSGPAQLGTENQTYILNILEDDAVFFLGWETTDGTNDVDLDFVVKIEDDVANASAQISTDGNISTGGEALFIPAGFPAGTYSLYYPYYSGTSNSVTFRVYMLNTAGTLNGTSYPYSGSTALSYSGTYTLNNINEYSDFDTYSDVTIVAQTMVKSGINYTNISSITTLSSGSRTGVGAAGVSQGFKLDKAQLKRVLGAVGESKRK